MPEKSLLARAAAGLLLLSLAALPSCRSMGGDGFITAPRAVSEASSEFGPELVAPEQTQPAGPASAAAARGRGGGGAGKARESEPFEPAASSAAARPGERGPASADAFSQEGEKAASEGSLEGRSSSGTARGRPHGGEAAREAGHTHPSPAGPEGGAPEGGNGRAARGKKVEVPVQDLTRRPFRLKQKAGGAGVPAAALPMGSNLAEGAPAAAPDSETPPPLTQLDTDMSGSLELETMLVGAYLIQMSTAPDFSRLVFNKVYDFMEDQDVFGDIAALELRKGRYWVRYAFLDLLGGQHPFSKPRSYAYRPPEKKPPEEPRKKKS
ncbi:MAG: hypothetical protein HY926_03345 [Elusimicrobia bacterium]|nr:hypothetical protein [Elusimicrobiota bacterium]